jgi:hypothetical protein
MHGSAQPEENADLPTDAHSPEDRSSAETNFNDKTRFGEMELDSALQLLVERTQYITGATGTALALPNGEEMLCRASSGSCAPAIGARLQVRSGLTGESISRRQLLRCDNAEADPRVNIEACRALGIASIVVLPLLRRSGEVRGLFELFSDHPYAFEERDLIALERMAALTLTALDLAEQRQHAVAPSIEKSPAKSGERVEPSTAGAGQSSGQRSEQSSGESSEARLAKPTSRSIQTIDDDDDIIGIEIRMAQSHAVPEQIATPATQASDVGGSAEVSARPEPAVEQSIILPQESPTASKDSQLERLPAPEEAATPVAIPEAMRRVQKCSSCGFPVSEGRTRCLDCEKQDSRKKAPEKKQSESRQAHEGAATELQSSIGTSIGTAIGTAAGTAAGIAGGIAGGTAGANAIATAAPGKDESSQIASADLKVSGEEFVPAFLADAPAVQESWLANHVNVLAVIVLILGILVAVVVFR